VKVQGIKINLSTGKAEEVERIIADSEYEKRKEEHKEEMTKAKFIQKKGEDEKAKEDKEYKDWKKENGY